MEQFDPTKHGIYRRLLADDGELDSRAWNRAAEGGEHVGTCRGCGSYLLARPTDQAGPITWYTAVCAPPGCGKEIAAPGARYLRRSSRRSQMPTDEGAKS